ncbi:hypothetical protein [Paenibacillus qinlingensis]|uniref:Inhibitor of sigma-G Gin n=1 Tax=Paenibacillus qinlingensis TaxID=1837343 RepID=A0ABU1P1P8_9BACL|nr:hypothetical protein [Paenibacillus qinlingensis]MDR6553459.1 hypothetical protein [Paenibacillus qinlingensis]
MEELIGHCRTCEKPIYCRMGFLDGVVQPDKTLLCFDCSSEVHVVHVIADKEE